MPAIISPATVHHPRTGHAGGRRERVPSALPIPAPHVRGVVVEFRVLGPLQAVSADRVVPVRGLKQRAALGLLLLHAGTAVPAGRLADELWGDHPPASADSALRNVVLNLRRALAAGPEDTRPAELLAQHPGYV